MYLPRAWRMAMTALRLRDDRAPSPLLGWLAVTLQLACNWLVVCLKLAYDHLAVALQLPCSCVEKFKFTIFDSLR